MSFQDEAVRLFQEGNIGVAVLVGEDNQIYWKMGEWDFDPIQAIQDWKAGTSPVFVGGLKFSVIRKEPDRFVATNLQQQGHLIIAQCPFWPGYLIAWAPSSVGPDVAYAEVAKLAAMVKS